LRLGGTRETDYKQPARRPDRQIFRDQSERMAEQSFQIPGPALGLPALLHISRVRSQVASRVTWHSHEGYELLFLLEGATAYEFAKHGTVELHGGHFLVVPPGAVHRGLHNVRSPSTVFGLAFRTTRIADWKGTTLGPADLRQLNQTLARSSRSVHPFGNSLRWLVRHLAEETAAFAVAPAATESAALIRALVCATLIEAVRQMRNPPTQPKEFVAAAVDYLRAHLHETVRMSDLVRHVGFSRARLFDIFKAQTGLTPNHYLQKLRIERAQEQLRNTRASITEIAHATGFSSGQYFSTVFSRYTGVSPSDFRKAGKPAR
jgi:AraC-like DNA-binding protein/quercetin dioxygenase-like cupin family protein